MKRAASVAIAGIVLMAIAIATAACNRRGSTITAEIDWDPPPLANTPEGPVRLLEWCWNRRDTTAYRGLFTSDFKFVFHSLDSAGNRFPGRALVRDLELAAARAIFVTGTTTEPPPLDIRLTFDPNLVALPDPRPGRSARAHRMIAVPLLLRLEQPDIEVTGGARFYLVRGDSAAWPPGVAHGPGPDSTRWWVERWEDETLGDPGLSLAMPGGTTPFGRVKVFYLEAPPGRAARVISDAARSAATRGRKSPARRDAGANAAP